MSALRAWLVLAFAVGAASSACAAASISDLVAALQDVQARIAQGDRKAIAAQADAARRVASAIAEANPSTWASDRELRAVAIYLLSGGDPRSAVTLVDKQDIRGRSPELAGAFAYAVGRRKEAARILGKLDPLALDPRLAGQCAYALSILAIAEDEKRAVELLDMTRLLSPGTLVEEAALRREALLVAEHGDGPQLRPLMRRYLTRFPRSPYVKDFVESLAAVLDKRDRATLDAMIEPVISGAAALDPEPRAAFVLAVARTALTKGAYRAAEFAAVGAGQIKPASAASLARARLYLSVARMMLGSSEAGSELAQTDAKALPAADQPLLRDSLAIRARLLAPTSEVAATSESATAPSAPIGKADDKPSDPVSRTLQAGSLALQDAANIDPKFLK